MAVVLGLPAPTPAGEDVVAHCVRADTNRLLQCE
jgi:hypothetical protein